MFIVPEDGIYRVEIYFYGNASDTDLDLFIKTPTGNIPDFWSSSHEDNPGTQEYRESIETYLTQESHTIAVQAWPSWIGMANYQLTIRKAT